MLILGRRYKFTRFELRKMIKKFKTIKTVAYEGKEPTELIEEIKQAAERTKSKLVILNIEPIIKDELVKVLTKLSLYGLTFMTLEHFMFKHLDKYYIDYEHTYRDWETDRKSTRLNSSHRSLSRMPSSA